MPSPKRAGPVATTEARPASAPRKRAPQKRALEKRAAIIEAAIEEFSNHGYSGATTRQIANKAGVLNSLLHHHFPEKDDLWRACADVLFQDFGEELRRIRQHVEPGVPLLKAVIRAFLVGFVQRPEMGHFLVLDNRVDLSRQAYVTERHLEGLYDWFTASIRIAQGKNAVPQGDPLIVATFFLHAVTAIGSRKGTIELTLKRPLNAKAVAEYETLLNGVLFGAIDERAEPAAKRRSR